MAVNAEDHTDKDSNTRMIAQGLLGRLRARDVERRGRRLTSGRGDATAAARRRRLGPRGRLALLCVGVLLAVLAGGWLWLRDSPLVAVEHVTVSGESGPDSAQIRTALIGAAHAMTTLDVNTGQLRKAVAAYPQVQDVKVSTDLPHGLHIEVIERTPVGVVLAGGQKVDVAGDGTLMYDVPVSANLPVIPLRVPPGGKQLTDPAGKDEVALLAAAPERLLAKVSAVSTQPTHGLVAQLRGGPSIYFGDASRLAAKWISAEAVLADSGSEGAVYIDVTDPRRPAAGAGSGQGTAAANP